MSNYMKLKIICPKMPDNNSNMDLAKQRKQILHEWQIKYKKKINFQKQEFRIIRTVAIFIVLLIKVLCNVCFKSDCRCKECFKYKTCEWSNFIYRASIIYKIRTLCLMSAKCLQGFRSYNNKNTFIWLSTIKHSFFCFPIYKRWSLYA